MIPISSAISGGLLWSKIPHQRGFQLKSNGEDVGSLRPTNFWATEFQAESTHGSWKFRRTGFFNTSTEITDSKSDVGIATFRENWSGRGTLAFSDGMRFQINPKGFWRPVWTVQTEDGKAVLNIHPREKAVEFPGEMQLSDDRLSLLAIFALHAMERAEEEYASTAALFVATG
jgi:hypothetical protein